LGEFVKLRKGVQKVLARSKFLYLVPLLSVVIAGIAVKGDDKPSIQAGSKIYVAPMGGFETYLKSALE